MREKRSENHISIFRYKMPNEHLIRDDHPVELYDDVIATDIDMDYYAFTVPTDHHATERRSCQQTRVDYGQGRSGTTLSSRTIP